MTNGLRGAVAALLSVCFAACGSTDVRPVVAGAATVEKQAGEGQSVVVGTAVATPLAVLVRDGAGSPLGGISVQWAVASGGGSVPASSSTGSDGVASAGYTAGTTAGMQVVRATVPGAAGSPGSVTLIATPGPAHRLTERSGTGQSGRADQPLASPFVVAALDRFENGVPGVTVTWAVTTGGGTLDQTRTVTDATGEARVTLTPGAAGTQTVTASADGLVGSPVAFAATATTPPVLVATVAIPPNYGIHDMFVRDGLAFVCAWNSGLMIYDVGNGVAGGTPASPRLISQIVTAANGVAGGAQVHNAWWFHNPVTAEKRYVFVGQEGPATIGSSSSGDIHVVDVSNLAAPVEVAFYHLDGAGTHNFWMDEQAQILYAAYYNGGVVALNVSGTLSGDLATREIARIRPGGTGNTFVWGVQLFGGSLYASDMLSGLWQLRLSGTSFTVVGGGGNVPERYGSDLWVANGFAYSGTWGSRGGRPGNAVKVWQLSLAGAPQLVDSIVTAGIGTLSDVEVSANGGLLMFSAENGPNAGLHFYSLAAQPGHPESVASYLVGTGVHTATLATIGGRLYAFAAKNPSSPALLILDLTGLVP